MNKEKFAIIEIRKIIKERNGGIFSDKDILETISEYIDNFFMTNDKPTSWNFAHNDEFQKDIRSELSTPMLSIKYRCSLQAIYYHRRRIQNELKTTT